MNAQNWIKSSRCNGQTACVEFAFLADGNVALRDSKEQDGPVLAYSPAEWEAFVLGVKAGEFDTDKLTVDAATEPGEPVSRL
ncbi:DUF397 domain-containing protein [Nonomuraea typhae]|uniref:DUF397 domain-containing protein n=1 Tax=Nonomuraea typhae TaxID=2603600 RepID=UPI0012FA667F|nr:DUF397 domain-containing protein [Nonomuraea typhae]